MTQRRLPLLLITLAAFALRTWQLDSVPPGWSDDELSNIYVVAQKIFAGHFAVYYTDATGLEAPYHVLSGFFLRLLGFNVLGIRLLSAALGALSVPLAYQVGRKLFNRYAGVLAAAALAVSFWSLIYSRVNLRHIALPVMALATFYAFWRALSAEDGPAAGGDLRSSGRPRAPFLLPGLLLGLSLYTYFAARGLPLILAAFVLYLALFDRARLRRHGRGLALAFGVAAVVALPLLITIEQEAGADARVIEVAVPLLQAREGNFEPLGRHVRVTLSMFHGDGDDEHLYNIPHRPLFGAPVALLFWMGVALAAWYALQPLRRRPTDGRRARPKRHELACAFLLLWWAAGISPGFLSVPPASLGHTILAQPATYLLLVLPLWRLQRLLRALDSRQARPVAAILGLLLVAGIAWRDLPDYFVAWPQQGMVRFLYHADVADVARSVAQREGPADFAIAGLLAGPWDRLALDLALEQEGTAEARPRWYHAQRAAFLALGGQPAVAYNGYPRVDHAYEVIYQALGPRAGGYRLSGVDAAYSPTAIACFHNGLCLHEAWLEVGAEGEPDKAHLTWRVQEALQLPEIPLWSKPPPPGVYAGPRLLAFAQLWRGEGDFIAGDDGLWVDAQTLQAGDVFRQQHHLESATLSGAGDATLLVGLYDPLDGRRILTHDGQDHVRITLNRPDEQ